ncbi:MAG: putative lipid II flippase FtsW [Endozoicomonadaceae bacterium]|nr:putative lipid II flippase FtsW [Endozoicomonadaceae bacterium]
MADGVIKGVIKRICLPQLEPSFLVSAKDRQVLDYPFIASVLILMLVGLVMIASASTDMSSVHYGSAFHFFLRQSIFVVVAVAVMAAVQLFPISFWQQWGVELLGLALSVLVLVLFVGREINGSVRWIPLGFFNLQASEVAKFGIVVYMASYLERRKDEVRDGWWGFIKPLMVLLVAMVLLLVEPDFGAVVVLMFVVLGMVFLAGVRLRQYFVMIALSLVGIVLAAISQPYRMRRLTTYMDPWAYQFESGYQLTQSLIAFGRGGWLGEGLGHGIQKQFYLPEAHTDFIFAVIAEEFGLLGSIVVIMLLAFVTWRALRIGYLAEKAGYVFSGYMAYGFGLLIGIQVFINIGVSSGLLPTKGLALPFLSYGGSNLLMNCLTMGLLVRIDYERRIFSSGAVRQAKND